MTIRVGTRGSALATAQAGLVARDLETAAGEPVELVIVRTEGDRNTASLATIGGTGVFASALRDALRAGEVDAVVHSLKDLPTAPAVGLVVGAVPGREDARDALCARDGLGLAGLPVGATVGTGSPRRAAQLGTARPDLRVVDIRGNVDTRLRMVESGELDAVVLSLAGLTRLGREAAATEVLPLEEWPTAPGQGALAIEVRSEDGPRGDSRLAAALRTLHVVDAGAAITAERVVLAGLEAGCAAPIGATAAIRGDAIEVRAEVHRPGGGERIVRTRSGALPAEAEHRTAAARAVGAELVDDLLAAGAARLAPLGVEA